MNAVSPGLMIIPLAQPPADGAGPPVDYVYDLFISYRRRPLIEEWLGEGEFFHYLLTNYLADELGRPPLIFRDVERLRAGDRWADKLEHALWSSRCIITIGTGDYFASAWCRAEFDAFDVRARNTKREVIVPLAWHDWQPKPQPLAALQIEYFHDLAFIGLKQDQRLSVPFQQRMRTFASAVADKIKLAPPFDPSAKPVVPRADSVLPPDIDKPRS